MPDTPNPEDDEDKEQSPNPLQARAKRELVIIASEIAASAPDSEPTVDQDDDED